ncbi:tetraacyldisaccharide 4'-kinase [Advenella kashmirensis WT001]|uniref:Tetraacyldisaccharide 4'-kinase n=1 Tax=Advenella kashmirensis (strain DSM 17095 / LMG 22695 / WT001) TaxID=1036672 RepID=I3UDE7_ADVKW|nr:tetraacyldisaccharide 4'-kinase [Advenella kashmirensis WT001]
MQQYPDTTVIIADDGLQHLALGRDIEIAVQDSRGIGNGRLLPAGPLREPATRLASVDYLIINTPADEPVAEPAPDTPDPGQPRKPQQVNMQLHPTCMVHLRSGRSMPAAQWVTEHLGQRIAAIAGIGHPPRFFRTLAHAGIGAQQTIAFPDHHAYSVSEIRAIDADVILMTAKDAAKCQAMQDERLWSMEVALGFPMQFFLTESPNNSNHYRYTDPFNRLHHTYYGHAFSQAPRLPAVQQPAAP